MNKVNWTRRIAKMVAYDRSCNNHPTNICKGRRMREIYKTAWLAANGYS